MKEQLDLVKILKDCPKETKFYSPVFGEIEFIRIEKFNEKSPIVIKWFINNSGYIEYLTKEGTFRGLGECIIFPSKDQRDWSKWHRPFKDGDILSYQNKAYKNRTIYIYKYHSKMNTSYYVALSGCSDSHFLINDGKYDSLDDYNDTARFATEKEKQRLFDAIELNGYKWNEETKTLEKLIVPKFKVGDIIQDKNNYKVKITEVNTEDELYGYESLIAHGIGGFSFNEQDNWELAVKPKFKVGDSIQSKNDTNHKFTITNIDNDGFYHGCGKNGYGKICEYMIPVVKQDNWELIIKYKFKVGDKIRHKSHIIEENIVIEIRDTHYILDDELALPFVNQDNYELVPNKFNYKTLKPFDKVLVRDNYKNTWVGAFFSHINDSNSFWYKFVTIGGTSYKQMIPYNEETKHLLGTNNEAPEYYRCLEN